MTLVVVLLLLGQGALDVDCRDAARSRREIGQAHAFEITHAENASWESLQEALARCRSAAATDRCEAEARHRYQSERARAREAIEAKYRRIIDELEARCRAPIVDAPPVRRG